MLKKERADAEIKDLKKNLVEFSWLISMSDEELKDQYNEFPAPELNRKTNMWETTTAFCSLGGCEYRHRANKTEREALIQSIVATKLGEKTDTNGTCPECYREYMRDSI